MLRKALLILLAILFSLSYILEAGEKGFAIIIDNETYEACRQEIDAYRSLLLKEDYSARIISRKWNTPMEVKDELLSMYRGKGLEGAVFIGQIPIPMIRDAQHFTSAFKMDQERFPFNESSVPSDRYYDDFDLRFDYLSSDSIHSLFHYFSLRWDSPQGISCDIYTGRIKPTMPGNEGYDQIRQYFRKLFAARNVSNPLDVIISYTGEGSFSNSLTAWKEEGVTMREQFPQAFSNAGSAKFLIYAMYPYMKETLIREMKRDDVDLMLFHEHGTPDRQYITGMPESRGIDEYAETAKRLFRSRLRKEAEKQGDVAKLKREWMNYYHIDSTWFSGADDPEMIRKDSAGEIRTGIVLEDIPGIAPNPEVVIFDACYNGDFREEKYIAGEYIFAGGKTLVAIGNSVNVLQDKSSSDLLGLLGLGYTVGEWAMLTNILESHIIGDPTFFFQKTGSYKKMDLHSGSISYWLRILKNEDHPDLKGVALHRLFDLNYAGLPDLLVQTYHSSPSSMLRLQVFHLLQFYNDGKFEALLRDMIRDPYEFIRRKSTYSMGRIGKDEFIPYIATVYLNDFLDERVRFNAEFCFELMNPGLLEKEITDRINTSTFLYDRKKCLASFKAKMDSRRGISEMGTDVADTTKKMRTRLMGVSSLRNNNYHVNTGTYLSVLADPQQDLNLRIKLAEALGWFTLSFRKGDIIDSCKKLASLSSTDPKLKNELLKTVNRLELYMR